MKKKIWAFIYFFLKIIGKISKKTRNVLIYAFYYYKPIVNDLRLYNSDVNLKFYPTIHTSINRFCKQYLKKIIYSTDGVPCRKNGDVVIYNPVQIIQFGLLNLNLYLSNKDNDFLVNVEKCIKWLVDNQDKNDGTWKYRFDYHIEYLGKTLEANWSSAMAQGQAISLFQRWMSIFPTIDLSENISLALKALSTKVEEGGVLTSIQNYQFLDEYPLDKSSYTLNGFLFCIVGLIDISENHEANSILKSSILTIENILHLYDNYPISTYNLSKIHYASSQLKKYYRYHFIHVILLKYINKYANSSVIQKYINKWVRM